MEQPPQRNGPYISFKEWKGFGFGEREKTAVSIEKFKNINSLRDGEKMDMQEQNSAGSQKWMQFEKRCKSKKKKKTHLEWDSM